MEKREDIFEEVRAIIENVSDEIVEAKNPIIDKRTNQVSIKIPKSIAGKSKLNNQSKFKIVFQPKKETIKKLSKSKLVIFLE